MSRENINQLALDIASRNKTNVPAMKGCELDELLYTIWCIKRAIFR